MGGWPVDPKNFILHEVAWWKWNIWMEKFGMVVSTLTFYSHDLFCPCFRRHTTSILLHWLWVICILRLLTSNVCLFHIVPSPMDCSQLNNVCCLFICKTFYIWTHLVITPHLQDRHFNQHFKNEETETEVHTYNLGVWKVEAESGIQSQPWLPSDFMASLGYIRCHFILFFKLQN